MSSKVLAPQKINTSAGGLLIQTRKSVNKTTPTASTTMTNSISSSDKTNSSSSDVVTVANTAATATTNHMNSSSSSSSVVALDFDDFTTSSSILEFLSKEQECCSEADTDSIFQEVSRMVDNSDTRSVDEILREAELLIQQQTLLGRGGGSGGSGASVGRAGKSVLVSQLNSSMPMAVKQSIKMNAKYTKLIENVRPQQQQQLSTLKLVNGHCQSLSPSPPPPSLTSVKMRTNELVVTSPQDTGAAPTTPQTPLSVNGHFEAFVDNLPSVSVISEESTPKDMLNFTNTEKDDTTTTQLNDNDDDDTEITDDTMEEITEGIETIELLVNEEADANNANSNETVTIAATTASATSMTSHLSVSSVMSARTQHIKCMTSAAAAVRRPSYDGSNGIATLRTPLNTATCIQQSTQSERRNSGGNGGGVRRSSMTTPDSGIGGSHNHSVHSSRSYSSLRNAAASPTPSAKTYCDKSVNSSPKLLISTLSSPIESVCNISREHALKQEIDQLQEKLKDTEERLQSLRIQHDSLSQLHRDMRESNTHLQEESEMLKLDVQHLNECANILRTELQSARSDRNEALELQKALQTELDETRQDKKLTQEQKEKDAKIIQDLQRQCREMERILMRKHPDSVSALIVASKSSGKFSMNDQDNMNSRKLLEQRIAQLEADAKEQDYKAQQILANVQARFNSVQSKYETHIADLETQVLSLQEINTKLNEKIESQVRTLDYFVTKKAERFYNNCTQTETTLVQQTQREGSHADGSSNPANAYTATSSLGTQTNATATATRDHSTNTIGTSNQHSASSSTSSTANSTPNTSRPNSKQSGLRKPTATASGALTSALTLKLPVSQPDLTVASYHAAAAAAAKEDAHLLATIRGMRVDLAIKDKAVQRLTRELDECKKTIKKLQREKDAHKSTAAGGGAGYGYGPSTSRRTFDTASSSHYADQTPANTENQALREAQNKFKLLEADYKSLHDKRLQDLKTLQTAHERELASCHETVRILQQRLNERDEAFAMQKRRKLPVDYYALKAKVSSLERRHSEREERLHMLVEALSKGRLNGALEDLLAGDNNNQ